jgi:alanyl-tRNA synthetase
LSKGELKNVTDRLYYNDSYLREFDATVTGVEPVGERIRVALDRTAFYPTSGGQPFDTGRLGQLRVVDVVDDDGGTIAHVVEGGAVQVGDRVHATIDWARRFDHMQQHTGQHMLSAAFERLLHARTLSFHLGTAVSTIDLAREIAPHEIAAAEAEANRVVWEDRAVAVRYAAEEEAATLALRKEPVRGGTLRLIDIQGFDLSACGGTHVARTGAIGVIAVASWERFKGGQRIEFLCGGRALERFRRMRDTVAGGMRLLSVAPEDLAPSIERLLVEGREQKRALDALRRELAQHRAAALVQSARPGAHNGLPVKVILRAIDADADELKSLAAAVVSNPGFVAVLLSASRPSRAVVARSADVAVAANQVLAARFGGRGGGRPELAQGGGLDAPGDEILDLAAAQLGLS